jgi:Raf kinase inhibitor-like YbhB/YbcL family protein
MGNIVVKSSAFKEGGTIPEKHTCDGENVNPLLEILGAPEGTKTLALIMDDPDATSGGVWVHWLIWNIEPKTQYIHEDNLPAGAVLGTTSFGKIGYGGPCPPRGNEPHRYMFKVYALDSVLDLAEGAKKEELLQAMEGHVLDEGVLIGLYARK